MASREILYLFIGLFLASDCRAATERKTATVFAKPVQLTDLSETLTYPARVEPRVSATVLAESDGVIRKIYMPIGQGVSRGQKIMTIGHTDPIYQYAPMQVGAPVTGVISSLEVTEGAEVARGQKLATVTDPKQLAIRIEVPAPDVAQLGGGAGTLGEFRLIGNEATLPVRIRGLSPFIDTATGTASCEIEVDQAARAKSKSTLALSPGVLGQVNFRVNRHQGISIPESAVYYKGNEPFVRLVESGKAKFVKVALGRRERGAIEITQGLTAGNVLIERASRFVADGDVVKLEESPK